MTILLAASSYITGFNGKTDPKADQAFIAVATAYANGADIVLPLPKRDTAKIPLFEELWQSSILKIMPEVELSDRGFEEISEAGARHFAEFAEGEAWHVARWIAFQFAPNVAHPHLERSDLAAVKRCCEVTKALMEAGKLDRVRTALDTLQKEEGLQIPDMYRMLVGSRAIPSRHHLCVAYALSVALRGHSYAIKLSECDGAPHYRNHWIRDPIVRRIEKHYTGGEAKEGELVEFPWGVVLRRVFDKASPLMRRDPESVIKVLNGIRERRHQMREATEAGLFEELEAVGAHTRITPAEQFVLTMLLDLGVSPLYSESRFLHRLLPGLRLLAAAKPLFKVPVELITAKLQPYLLRKADSYRFLRFRRNSFWKYMQDPGIREAIGTVRWHAERYPRKL